MDIYSKEGAQDKMRKETFVKGVCEGARELMSWHIPDCIDDLLTTLL